MSEIKETEKVTNKLNESAETNVLKGKLDDNCKREYSREDLNDKKIEKGKEECSLKDMDDKETEKEKKEVRHEDLKSKDKDSETNGFKEKLDDYCKEQCNPEGFKGKEYLEKNSGNNPEDQIRFRRDVARDPKTGRFIKNPDSPSSKPSKHASPEFKKAKAELKKGTIDNQKEPSFMRGWLKQEQNQRGNNPKNWRNPPGYDAGHVDPDDNTRLRWETASQNRSRGAKQKR